MATIKANFLRAWATTCWKRRACITSCFIAATDWHITDDPSWSAESQIYPNFTDPRFGGPLNSQAYYSVADQARGESRAWGHQPP